MHYFTLFFKINHDVVRCQEVLRKNIFVSVVIIVVLPPVNAQLVRGICGLNSTHDVVLRILIILIIHIFYLERVVCCCFNFCFTFPNMRQYIIWWNIFSSVRSEMTQHSVVLPGGAAGVYNFMSTWYAVWQTSTVLIPSTILVVWQSRKSYPFSIVHGSHMYF